MTEEWKDVEGYEGLYQVSNFGKIRSIYRYKRELKPLYTNSGYIQAQLCKDKTVKAVLVHRIVANAFIPNTENKPCINHKDGNKHNNHISNLEWCTFSENEKHSYKVLKKKTSKGRLGMYGSKCYNHRNIIQYTIDGKFVKEYESRGEASRITGISSGSIWLAMNGKRNYAGGFIWKYK